LYLKSFHHTSDVEYNTISPCNVSLLCLGPLIVWLEQSTFFKKELVVSRVGWWLDGQYIVPLDDLCCLMLNEFQAHRCGKKRFVPNQINRSQIFLFHKFYIYSKENDFFLKLNKIKISF